MKSTRRDLFKMIAATALLSPVAMGAGEARALPTLELAAPIDRWDEAIPLGNGLMGGLLWGAGPLLKLSLDRGDLWDLRTPELFLQTDWTYATLKQLVAEKNQDEIVRRYDKPYNVPYPTKVPAGRLEVTLAAGRAVQAFRLDLGTATGRAELGSGAAEVFFSAKEPIALFRIPGGVADWRIVAPASVKKLGYAPAAEGRGSDLQWYLQTAALGLKYAVVAGMRKDGDSTEIAIAICSTKDAADPVAEGERRVKRALGAGYAKLFAPHAAWWRQFWAQSHVTVPEPAVQLQYDEVQYFYGAASRRGAPPIPLQGVWTADEGTLPPWHGDYHNDLNTQLTYWAYLASGHFDEGAAFLDFLWGLLPRHRRFARSFYDAPGAAVPGVMTLDGKPMGGWCQYALSPTMGAWLAQSFYLHWRYTMDDGFLRERAYPYCREIAECLRALLRPGPDGKLVLPLSSSPEIHDNTLAAWLMPNSNFDLGMLRWLFGALEEMAPLAGRAGDAKQWRDVRNGLADLAVEGTDGALRLSPDESLTVSHRHHSHLTSIYPLGFTNVEGTERERHIIDASLRQLKSLGTSAWCGYSFSWLAAMAARVGNSDLALQNLHAYLDAFISRNGFHLNGDYKGKGYARSRYRPFTLEGNFAAAQAVHEMLLQSWGGLVRIFPAVPEEWADVSFENLRAEGAFTVSARRSGGRTVSVRIMAVRGGALLLRDPFGGARVTWNRGGVSRKGPDYLCTLESGTALEGHA